MAWLEVHQTIWRHRKTLVLAHSLGIRPTYAAAHLAHLWCWAIDNALLDFDRQQGHLTGLPAAVIAAGADWDGEPDPFVAALMEAGWLDREGDRLVMHDWWDYAGKLIEERQRNAQKQRDWRNRHKPDTVPPVPADAPPPVTVTSPSHNTPTVPNPTVQDRTNQEEDEDGAAAPPPRAIDGKRRSPEEMAAHEPAAFARLWAFYGKLGSCEKAARAWDELRPNRALMQAMRQAIDDQRAAFGWGEAGGQAQPHLSTWLHQRRWEWDAVPNKVEILR